MASTVDPTDDASSNISISDELHAVVQRITLGLSLDDALAGILRATEKLLGASSATIFLTQPDGSIGRKRYTTRRTGQPHWDDSGNPRPNGITTTVLRTGQAVAVGDALADPRAEAVARPGRRSFAAVPIRYADRTLGVLYANWAERREHRATELHLLETLATYGAISIENARLHHEETAARREADEMQDRLYRFVANVAHDLEGPLTLVVAYSELLRLSTSDDALEVAQRALPGMERAARRIQQLVHDLQAVARIGDRQLEVTFTRFDLVDRLRTVVEQQQVTTRDHQLVLDAPSSLIGEWDATRISEVFTNLVSNAIRYTVDGGTIRIMVSEAGELVLVRVIDPGIGIAPDHLPRLFQPFSQLSPEPTTKGAGLGLYIAKAIVELHGGQIWAKSVLGRGSTFSVALPRWRRKQRDLY